MSSIDGVNRVAFKYRALNRAMLLHVGSDESEEEYSAHHLHNYRAQSRHWLWMEPRVPRAPRTPRASSCYVHTRFLCSPVIVRLPLGSSCAILLQQIKALRAARPWVV